jgi:hypothetical protein
MLAVLLLVGCASPPPEPTQAISPSPRPVLVCEPADLPADLPDPPFSCLDAAHAAVAGLSADHRPIDRIVVFFGSWCSPGTLCGFSISPIHDGYVVFDVRDPFFDLWAQVHADDEGTVTLTSEVVTFPGGRYPWRPR